MDRPTELHVSALSPAEFRAYTRYLDLLALAQARTGAGVDADGSVRFDRAVVREFAVERLDTPRTLADDVIARLGPGGRLGAGQVYAALRLLAHAAARSPRSPRPVDGDLVFVPVDPLPLDPEQRAAPPPPRRVPSASASAPGSGPASASGSVSASGSASGPASAPVPLRRASAGARPAVPPKPATLPRPASPRSRSPPRPRSPARPPSPPPRRARQSLPPNALVGRGFQTLDPFRDMRDSPSPTGSSSSKTRAYSTSSAIGSNNPFRGAGALAPIAPIAPISPGPTGGAAGQQGTDAASSTSASTSRVGPPLPPRKPSIKRPGPGPALPPRQPPQVTRAKPRADSLSSASTWSETSLQPTSTSDPSDIMKHSLAAAAAARTKKDDGELHVIRSNYGSVGQGPTAAPLPPPLGRRDIIDTVNRAVRHSEVDPPPPPPQRVPSLRVTPSVPTRPKPLPSPTVSSSSNAFHMSVETYRQRHPSLKTWSPVALLADRPSRSLYAMIILNQPVTRKDTLLRSWASSTLRFCADGGANRLYDALDPEERAIMLPTMIKGDLDSIRPDVRAYYASKGVTIKRDGDEYSTDLMKCLAEIESIEKASGKRFSVLLLGGLSGRLDQTVHTMSILFKLRERRRDTYVISEDSLAWVLDTGVHLVEIDHTTMGQTCGILPVGVADAFVRTEGLKWNLDWVTSLGGDLSTSNHLVPSEPAVFLETSAPVFWTLEIRQGLQLPRPAALSTVDELSRGVKEIGVGFVRAGRDLHLNLGRRLSRGHGLTTNGDYDYVTERTSEHRALTAPDRDYIEREGSQDGYAQLD